MSMCSILAFWFVTGCVSCSLRAFAWGCRSVVTSATSDLLFFALGPIALPISLTNAAGHLGNEFRKKP